MISEPAFATLTAASRIAAEPRNTDVDRIEPVWPANEIMLSALLYSGRSAEDIAALYRVPVGDVAERLSLVVNQAGRRPRR